MLRTTDSAPPHSNQVSIPMLLLALAGLSELAGLEVFKISVLHSGPELVAAPELVL